MKLAEIGRWQLAIVPAILLPALVTRAESPPVRTMNNASYVGSGRWDWKLWLDGEKSVLDRIIAVEYTLHPSFPQPVQIVTNRAENFALSASGWGEFTIPVKISFKAAPDLYLKHRLRLDAARLAPDPVSTTSSPRTITTDNTSKYAGNDRWDWSVFIIAPESCLNEIRSVEYTLHPTFPDPVREITTRGHEPGRGFFLNSNGWGTFKIGVKVVFRDGVTTNLTHQLRFDRQKAE